MSKSRIIDAVARVTSTKKTATEAVNTVFDEIKKSLKKGQAVFIADFGTFKVAKRKARTGKNPRTGETIKIAAKKVPVFKAGKSFKEMVK
ncbi:MAG: HU family DNA-binding protein [Candidatus Omnitrophica bacterium]|nr:HU family DNA-binding protein [Candidatus Omnitrophota bacterium]